MTSQSQNQNMASNSGESPPNNYPGKQQRSIMRMPSAHGFCGDPKVSTTAKVNLPVPSGHVLAPPQYQAAIASMVDSSRFVSRRSPEARAVQAVPPFGVHDAVISSAIPDECQVVKQLVREVVSGQLIPASTSSQTASSSSALLKVPQSSSMLPVVFGADGPANTVSSELPPLYHHCFTKNNSQQCQTQTPSYDNAASFDLVKLDDHPRGSISQPDISRLSPCQLTALSIGDALPRILPDAGAKVVYLPNDYKTQMVGEVPGSSGCQVHSNNVRRLSAPPPAYSESKDAAAIAKVTSSYLLDKALPPVPYNWLYGERNAEAGENRVTAQMMNLVTEENRFLRLELESYIKKTFKLQQLELQYQKIQREYEELVRRQAKREHLEQQMHTKMQQEVSRLKEFNFQLNEQLENALAQMSQYQMDEMEDHELKHEITRRDMMIAQLITQNKELLAAKERYTIELDAQRTTLEEQRTHIQILDKALNFAQEKVLKAEEQCRKKNIYVQKAEELQRALHTFQDGMKKREDNHKRIRAQLEKELAHLQIQKKESQNKALSSTNLQDLKSTTANLRRDLQDKEEQMLHMQSELVRWQVAYYDELKNQEAAINEAASSKDARIRILEENSSKAEKLIEVAQSESRRCLEDLRIAKNKVSDLETRVQSLEAQLAEKDAMINVLRRRQRLSPGNDAGNRSADATLEYSGSSDVLSTTYSDAYHPLEISKQRLEAVRRRLLQSPSPSRCYSRLYHKHNKLASVDASATLDDAESRSYGSLGRPTHGSRNGGRGAPGNKINHNQNRGSFDTYIFRPSYSHGSGSGGAVDMKNRDIFTLPVRSKAKGSKGSSSQPRPRSADDHLLVGGDEQTHQQQKTLEKTTPAKERKHSQSSNVSDVGTEKNSEEELWQV